MNDAPPAARLEETKRPAVGDPGRPAIHVRKRLVAASRIGQTGVVTSGDLDHDLCYRAARSRDARFDGRFFVAVKTTGIYCRPICPARTPLKRNVHFYPSAAAAEAGGFRPCRRCRPEVAPSSAAWSGTSATVSRALALIDDGALDDTNADALAEKLGVGARHLRRLFVHHLGAPPNAVAQTRRAHLARVLLEQSALPMTHIAEAAGFQSLRRFNAAMREAYGRPPRELRGRASAQTPPKAQRPTIDIRLGYRGPYDWAALSGWLQTRAINGIEAADERTYTRGAIKAVHRPEQRSIVVSIPAGESATVQDVARRARRLFDVAADPATIATPLKKDRDLAPLVRRHAGIRVPGAWDPFELAVRAIVGQQVSVAGARTILGRIATAHGGFAPEVLAGVTLPGMPRRRAESIQALAQAVASGAVKLERRATLDETIAMLTELPGVGPWTAHYIAMRALGETDAFPAGDLILRRNAGNLSEKELLRRAEAWRPWRAYAAMLLWTR
jgi:AraC family transcriptional regulator of adaptative response / DNA-3-methyladenine glycosylase II